MNIDDIMNMDMSELDKLDTSKPLSKEAAAPPPPKPEPKPAPKAAADEGFGDDMAEAMGFGDEGEPKPKANADIREILIDAATLSIDQLPMLQVIFDRVTTSCAERLRHYAATQPFFSLSYVESARVGDTLDAYEANAIIGVYHVAEWDNHILVGFDRDFVFSMIEVLFGSDGSEPPAEDERNFSAIETTVCNLLFEQVGLALQTSFSLVTNAKFKLDRTETRMDFAVIGRRSNLSVVVRFLLQAINRGGEMFLVIPQSVLTPMRQSLSRVISGESTTSRDPNWMKQIRGEVERTHVTIRAILEEDDYTLGDIASLQVGQVLKLKSTPRSPVKVESNDQPLFWGHVGQSEGAYTLRIDAAIDPKQEFLNDILAR